MKYTMRIAKNAVMRELRAELVKLINEDGEKDADTQTSGSPREGEGEGA